MISGHPIVDYCKRLFQISAVLTTQIGKLIVRWLRGRPLNGPDLLSEGFEKAGGTFVKFGQILALQVDTLPRAYCAALMRLLDRVPTASREHVLRVFEEDLNASPETLYRKFDYEAIASASIGQVHRAELHDGTPVAVKVQRPNVHQDFHRDVLVMRGIIWVVFHLRIKSLYFMRDPVRELGSWTHDELDYRREAAHCKLLADNAEGSATERIPRVYHHLTTARVLTMEFLDGPNVSTYLKYVERGDDAALARLSKAGFNPAVFSNNVITNFLRDAFRHGVFHADLHPANLLILPDNVVGYVDFGIVASLTPDAEIHIPDHVVRQDQQIGRMKIGVEDAVPEGIAKEVSNNVVAENRRIEPRIAESFECRMVTPLHVFQVGGNVGPIEKLHGQHTGSSEVLINRRNPLRRRFHGVVREQFAMRSFPAVIQFVVGPTPQFPNRIAHEVEALDAELEYDPNETAHHENVPVKILMYVGPLNLHRNQCAVMKFRPVYLANGCGSDGRVVELAVQNFGRRFQILHKHAENVFPARRRDAIQQFHQRLAVLAGKRVHLERENLTELHKSAAGFFEAFPQQIGPIKRSPAQPAHGQFPDLSGQDRQNLKQALAVIDDGVARIHTADEGSSQRGAGKPGFVRSLRICR